MIFLSANINRNKTIIPISNGKKTASTEIPIDALVSVAVTIGLPSPAVVKEEAPRVIDVKLCTKPAAPPPAIIDNVYLYIGSISTIEEAITIVPAINAVGPDIKSSILSTKGIK